MKKYVYQLQWRNDEETSDENKPKPPIDLWAADDATLRGSARVCILAIRGPIS